MAETDLCKAMERIVSDQVDMIDRVALQQFFPPGQAVNLIISTTSIATFSEKFCPALKGKTDEMERKLAEHIANLSKYPPSPSPPYATPASERGLFGGPILRER